MTVIYQWGIKHHLPVVCEGDWAEVSVFRDDSAANNWLFWVFSDEVFICEYDYCVSEYENVFCFVCVI